MLVPGLPGAGVPGGLLVPGLPGALGAWPGAGPGVWASTTAGADVDKTTESKTFVIVFSILIPLG